MSDRLLAIGKVAERSGCPIDTIRYYEKEELITAPARSSGGHRLYDQSRIDRLSFIRRSRELGFSMDEVRELLAFVDRKGATCEQVRDIADLHLTDIRAKIADLRRMEHTLVELTSLCTGDDLPACPIIEALQQGLG